MFQIFLRLLMVLVGKKGVGWLLSPPNRLLITVTRTSQSVPTAVSLGQEQLRYSYSELPHWEKYTCSFTHNIGVSGGQPANVKSLESQSHHSEHVPIILF